MEHRDALRQGTVLASAVLGIVGAFIGSGAAGGTPMPEVSGGALAADATLIAPGGPAFAIWTPIYAGLLAYAVWQLLPSQKTDARQRRLGYPIALSLLLNAAWILSVQFDLLALSVPIIVLLLVVLVGTMRIMVDTRPKNRLEGVLVDATMGLYLGWVCVATAANVAAVLVAAGFTGFGVSPDLWAVVVIGVAGLVGVFLAWYDRGRWAPTIALCWGLGWVAIARLSGEPLSVPAGVAALVCVAIVIGATAVAGMRARSGGASVRHARTAVSA
ncbi:tryptophan-rich sensory protein [Cryobacterium sp. MLB-32]|uniref:tryptophan-rich sensory protein n=1 Tax=Cryobacterium sp. MLB-32 TaxID=1529318 RepID=UPI00055E3B0F|nr:tryptophan-rich sensory protein [Cryobacterium sp. MLB-32]